MTRRSQAVSIFHDKTVFRDGFILEMTAIWVPKPVLGSKHNLKYAMYFGRPGETAILYDNERQKGDHRHLRGKEQAYVFTTLEKLVADFLADVEAFRAEIATGSAQEREG